MFYKFRMRYKVTKIAVQCIVLVSMRLLTSSTQYFASQLGVLHSQYLLRLANRNSQPSRISLIHISLRKSSPFLVHYNVTENF